MNSASRVLAWLLCGATLVYAQGGTFTKVRYNGGSVASKVDAKDWDNRLTVAPDAILLQLKGSQELQIPPKSVTSLSYGQEAHSRVETMLALAVLIAPVARSGFFHKPPPRFIGVQYLMPDGRRGGILLQGDKDNYRAILVALQGVTGVPVWVAEKERDFVPVSVAANVVRSPKEDVTAAQGSSSQAAAVGAPGAVVLTTNPCRNGMPPGGGYSRK